ncbi:hypothetical protein PISMIDRAFT_24329 [Pisolithus microcarpus 441]|uniref:F-box domain-containing protein n=1 Tax=Pisolithus microcarpus 441 TaxID=765257 RepID=A0A0C9Z066_9AGAM|nr:hypothetical protein BKA83DRAFT_24329 [Pisolithus microcarpus]KIK19664.1 hypothetical protein PISMIDRAFT_24329 [Pisolithus microcarpus 441]
MEGLYGIPMFPPVTLSEEFLWMVAVVEAEELDEILQTLHSTIVYTSQWRNTLASAARLPGDVLLLIFEHASPDRDTRMLRIFSQRCANLHIEGYGDDIEEILRSDITADEVPLLHRLSIHNISCFHNATTVTQLLSVLESLPNLKDLQLENSFISGEMDGHTHPRKVLLTQLTSLIFESSTVAGAVFLAALELPLLVKLEVAVDVGQLSTNICQFMGGVQLATSKMPHLPSLYIYYGHRLLIFQSNNFHRFPRLRVTFKNWALPDPDIPDTRFTDLIRGITDVAVLRRTQELKLSLPISIEQCLAPDAWTYFLHHLKAVSHISFGAHAPVFLICTLFLDACHTYEGMQAQLQLLPSLKHITLLSHPELQVLVHVLADARSHVGVPLGISASLQTHPHVSQHTGQPIEVVRQTVLDWLADPVVHSIPGDSTLFVDDEGTDSDEPDELDELLDEVDASIPRAFRVLGKIYDKGALVEYILGSEKRYLATSSRQSIKLSIVVDFPQMVRTYAERVECPTSLT